MANTEATPAEEEGIRPAKILVVDDEPDLEILVRQKFRRRIRRGEFEFTFAQNGLEALERLAENPGLEMILSDINMPRLDGLSLLNALGDVNPEIRAVMVSAYGDMDNIRTAMNRGAFDFVTKPIDFEDLETTIDKTLRHSRVMREALSSQNQLQALRQELNIAQSMQLSILPTSFPSTPQFEVHGKVIPAKEVGGDFYDIYRLDDGRLGVVIADVSGKGIPARAVHDGLPHPPEGNRDRHGLARGRPDRGQRAAARGEPGEHVRDRLLWRVQSSHGEAHLRQRGP